ncbi:MAG TPA: hypothetical protein VJQ46_10200 [Gemmatimonadales bacterium]|nr:hypothetical protein [Gemmatimonadales bacterium]
MRLPVAVALGVLTLAGCNKNRENRESGQVGAGMDTTVTTRQTKDTALIKHDTNVTVDTTMKRGHKTTMTDTTKKTGP